MKIPKVYVLLVKLDDGNLHSHGYYFSLFCTMMSFRTFCPSDTV